MTSESEDWAMPEEMRPRQPDVGFDLERSLAAIVSLRAEVPEDAFTAKILGTDRSGSGVLIDDQGTVLTIGYLITEAHTVWLRDHAGRVVQGYPLAYDQVTGFGLVKALGPLGAVPLVRGSVADCAPGAVVYVAGHGGLRHALKARLLDKREFAGYWEYLLDEALFTAPAFPQWSGAALIGEDGRLLGIGSLLVQEEVDGRNIQANMMVPIDLLEPILPQMLSTGQAGGRPRPWLGVYAADSDARVVVAGVAEGGPAGQAGLRQSDIVLEVAGTRVASLSGFLRAVWATGEAGTAVPLKVARGGDVLRIVVRSVDRNALLKRPPLH